MSATELFYHFKQAIKGEIEDFTVGSIRRSIFYLAIPMILEMVMESLFALVDIFFVGKLGVNAVASHSLHALITGWIFRKGKWKMVKV